MKKTSKQNKSKTAERKQTVAGEVPGTPTRVRVYRQGLGDCILIKIPKKDGSVFSILIDCGVAVATSGAAGKMTDVIDHLANDGDLKIDRDGLKTAKENKRDPECRIDVLAITHQHWDHVSGFTQAREALDKIEFGQVWTAWTEDPDDALAKTLRGEHSDAFALVNRSANIRASHGDDDASIRLLHLAGVLGAAGERTAAAMDNAKRRGELKFLLPTDPPIDLPGTDSRVYVLGPPHDAKAIRNYNPSRRNPETYELMLDGTGILTAGVSEALGAVPGAKPFSESASIPLSVAQSMPFFQRHYWGAPGDGSSWRRIDTDWLAVTDQLALMLQNATNNTSLVLAVELPDDKVLLFAADAQVGNWLSWQGLKWDGVKDDPVTGPELLTRTVFYKVGHHGSHSATLRENGLEKMTSLRTAVIPVDEVVAKKMQWGAMPLDHLIDALSERTGGRVFRTDRKPQKHDDVRDDPLFFEFSI